MVPGLVFALIAGTIFFAGHAKILFAAEKPPEVTSEPIRITADTLVTDNKARSAHFSGHVTAEQGDTQVTCDDLRIFFKPNSGQDATDTNNIERLEADGHVRIVFDNKLAVSNHAVYVIDERKLMLEGPGSKVTSGEDEITGTRITFYRNDGRMSLEGDDKSRVKAIIHSDQRGLN